MKIPVALLLLAPCMPLAAFAQPGTSTAASDAGFITISYPGAVSTMARAVTARGVIVGFFKDAKQLEHGFRYEGGTYTRWDCPGASETRIHGINSSGVMVGYCKYADGKVLGFRNDSHELHYIQYPGAIFTSAMGIARDGTILGRYVLTGTVSHAYLLRNGQFTTIDPPDMADPGGAAAFMNEAGDIAGQYHTGAAAKHAFILRNRKFVKVDYPSATATDAYALDDAGGLVGGYVAADGTGHGFRMAKDGSFATIDVPEASATHLLGTSALGDVVGWYASADGRINGFVRMARR